MDTYKINKEKYYKLDEILKQYPKFNKGCKTPKDVMGKYSMDKKTEYIYARYDNKMEKWIVSDVTSKKIDKVFITCEWFHNMFDKDEMDDLKDDVEDAPPIIKLKNKEKFYDEDDEIIHIEIRGKREIDACYFRAEDVSSGFDMPRLHNIVTDKRSRCEPGIHYKYFFCENFDNNKKIKKMFLTYFGLMKVFFSSRNKFDFSSTNCIIKRLNEWTFKTLFVAQKDAEYNYCNKQFGADLKSVMSVLKCCTEPVSCIYAIFIGTVKFLEKKYFIGGDIADNNLVLKIGLSVNLLSRIKQHKRKYGSQIQIIEITQIDPTYVFKKNISENQTVF